MTQEKFEQIRDTYTMEQWTMLSDEEFVEFSAMCTAADNRVFLKRWGHIGGTSADTNGTIRDGRVLRVIKGVSDNGRS